MLKYKFIESEHLSDFAHFLEVYCGTSGNLKVDVPESC
jgi:hypothetical protein